MADEKTTQLTAITALTDDDIIPVVNDPGGTPVTNKITWANVKATLLTYFYTIFPAKDGWLLTSWASPTRTGATTFTVAEDVTSYIGKGTKLKFTDTTTKFLPIKSAVYSGGVTTIVTHTTSDYALVGNPSSIYFSNIENPAGWPEYFNYTPTLTRLSAYTTCKFKVMGSTIHWEFQANGKNCTGAGDIQISWPVVPVLNQMYYVNGIFDGTSQTQSLQVLSATAMQVYKTIAAGNWAGSEASITILFSVIYDY